MNDWITISKGTVSQGSSGSGTNTINATNDDDRARPGRRSECSSGGRGGSSGTSSAGGRSLKGRRWLAPWKDSCERPVIYHCVTRVVERRLAFGQVEKEKFRTFMRMYV